MPNGTVKFFNTSKGFGFITADEGGKDHFVPATSLSTAGLSVLKMGQRVSFEAKPDAKGPKAVNIVLLADVRPPVQKKPDAIPAEEEKSRLVFYHDPANADSCKMLEKLQAAGHAPRVIEYLTAPPPRDELKALSLLLRAGDQSLVRKYDPLFFELCLDDRFISENEFWGAVFEHPSLINGPIVATQKKASLCHSQKTMDQFLAMLSTGWTPPAPERKSLPARLLQELNMKTSAAPAANDQDAAVVKKAPVPDVPAKKEIEKKVAPAAKPQVAETPKAQAVKPGAVKSQIVKPKPKTKAAAKPAPKAAAKSRPAR